jgi:hypothetical protein
MASEHRTFDEMVLELRQTLTVKAVCVKCLKVSDDLSYIVCPDCGGPVPLVHSKDVNEVENTINRLRTDDEYRQQMLKKYSPYAPKV